MPEKQAGPRGGGEVARKPVFLLHAPSPPLPTSGVPSGPHGTVSEEFAEVHFRVATSGQELLCRVLEFLVVLTNFGGKKLLPLI